MQSLDLWSQSLDFWICRICIYNDYNLLPPKFIELCIIISVYTKWKPYVIRAPLRFLLPLPLYPARSPVSYYFFPQIASHMRLCRRCCENILVDSPRVRFFLGRFYRLDIIGCIHRVFNGLPLVGSSIQ